MTQFKFPIGAIIARADNEPKLLIVGHHTSKGDGVNIYWTVDQDGVRDWQYADVVEAEFMEVES